MWRYKVSFSSKPFHLGYTYIYICDPLSENLAHPALYENRNKTGNLYINVAVKKWKRLVAWFLSCGAKSIADAECNFSIFTLLRVSVYYRVT